MAIKPSRRRLACRQSHRCCTAFTIGIIAGMALLNGCGGGTTNMSTNLKGVWGSKVAELNIQSTSVTYTNSCGGLTTLNGMVTPNATGDFVFSGPLPSNRAGLTGQYVGHIQGNNLHLTIIDPTTNTIMVSEDLTYGIHGQVPFLGCP